VCFFCFGSVLKKGFNNKKVHTVIYTHGHIDHCMGILSFDECADVQVIGHKNVPARFDRYKATNGYNAIINSKQFNAPPFFPSTFRYPDVTYEDKLEINVGGVQLVLNHHRGETDDATWVWIPHRKAICSGDFVVTILFHPVARQSNAQ